jgi:hypothetical protein
MARQTRRLPARLRATTPETVPAGKVLVHNQGWAGTRGFRAWLASATERGRHGPCDCGWAPKLGTHYRVTDLSMPGGGPASAPETGSRTALRPVVLAVLTQPRRSPGAAGSACALSRSSKP